MNPYLATGLAMCVIVAVSLALTAYLAVAFNRRAKADLDAALQPLAEAIDGTVDLERGMVSGRYEGDLAFGTVATGAGGIGRVFHTDIIDAAGGVGWEWSSLPSKRPQEEPTRTFESSDPSLEARLDLDWDDLATRVSPTGRDRFGFIYDPVAGHVRLTRAMATRRDIPEVATFLTQLETLRTIGRVNRRTQQSAR